MNEHIIYFDGVCNLCNGFVQFVINRDPKAQFKFAPLQSKAGEAMLSKVGKSTSEFDSIAYIDDDVLYEKSSAVLRIFKQMGGLWSWTYVFMIVPKFLRNAVYDLIANNRYRMFGKRDSCMLPTPDLKARFLD